MNHRLETSLPKNSKAIQIILFFAWSYLYSIFPSLGTQTLHLAVPPGSLHPSGKNLHLPLFCLVGWGALCLFLSYPGLCMLSTTPVPFSVPPFYFITCRKGQAYKCEGVIVPVLHTSWYLISGGISGGWGPWGDAAGQVGTS